MKLFFKNGHKSFALRLLGILLGVTISVGIVAYFINSSNEQTSKVSFKAAGVKYKEHFIVPGVLSPDKLIDKKQTKKEQKVQEILESFFQALEDENSTNSSLARDVKQSEDEEKMDIGLDLQILSSFDCVKSTPSVLLDYMSTMFVNEYGRSHKDIHSVHKIDQTIPLLNQFNINCGIDQNCSTLFQYDKQYGLQTSPDKTFKQNELFYCCPSVHSLTNVTMSNVCKRAQTVAQKSIFRESNDSTFLGRVIELSIILEPIRFEFLLLFDLLKVDVNNDHFMTNIAKRKPIINANITLNTVQLPAPDILQFR